ncbi:hypothetical protein J45TS6_42170 [Paenibacillus sp. J45TS6]|uniref:DUF11 domain-containing protein n=1 Tax=Paenibacillus sp. J45TS6 TaxID=2807196 RepID=UPI001B2B3004|nr:DUF11 domain-containing protein [Paenibacillus sp. J45TS6]GIP45758.1 hypothetical protein J45TS6_42170 [Paenibacillus sp. J45TS6]
MNSQNRRNYVVNNQSSVRFASGRFEGVSYSNMVSIPLTGAILTLKKSASMEQVTLDSIVMYQLEIENTGNAPAEVTLIDTLPEGTSFIPNSLLKDGVPVPGANPQEGLQIGILPINQKVTIQFQIIISSIPDSLTLTNVATASFTFQAMDGRLITKELISNPVTLFVSPSQLSIYYYANTNQTFEGDIITFFIQITNTGREDIRNAVVSTLLSDDEVAFVPGSVVIDGLLAPDLDPFAGITIPVVAANSTTQISYQVRIEKRTTSTPLTSVATLLYLNQGEEITIRSNPVSISYLLPVLTISVKITPVQVTYEDTVTYEVLIQNEGEIPVEAVYDLLQAPELNLVPGTVKVNGILRPEVSLATGLPLGTLIPHSSIYITFESKVSVIPNSIVPAEEWVNRSRLTYTFRINDGRSVQLTTLALTPVFFYAPRILLHVLTSPKYVEPGDDILFEITIRNSGNTKADLLLPLPAPGVSTILNGSIQWSDHKRELTVLEMEQQTVQITDIQPGELVQIIYTLHVQVFPLFRPARERDEYVFSDTIQALCTYNFNDRIHSFEVVSNVYEIVFTEHDE